MKSLDMRNILIWVLCITLLIGCQFEGSKTIKEKYLVEEIPEMKPLPFLPDLVSDKYLIHRGVFSNDLSEYYFTISDKQFQQFDVKVIKKRNDGWTQVQDAFFNSAFNDHGMSFAPDGKTLYFTSTRPTNIQGVADTWHIWKSEFFQGGWQSPEYVDIPNLREKLTSHPTITANGTLYFHSSNTDYSEMDLYVSRFHDGTFQNAEKVFTTFNDRCTPYVAPGGDYLIFANIGAQLDLMISYKKEGRWSDPKPLPESINSEGQGNPYITPYGGFLFYAKGREQWKVHWASTKLIEDPKN